MTELAGKVVIGTGASRGIGAAAAFVLAKAGAAVMLVARDGARASQVAKEIFAAGGRAIAWFVTSQITDLFERWSKKPTSGLEILTFWSNPQRRLPDSLIAFGRASREVRRRRSSYAPR